MFDNRYYRGYDYYNRNGWRTLGSLIYFAGVSLIVIVAVVWALGSAARYEERVRQQVEIERGPVLCSSTPWLSWGPFWMRAKNETMVRVVYQDTSGQAREVWARKLNGLQLTDHPNGTARCD